MDARLDPRQRQAVEVRTNAVVTAGAGSGKTTVLAERFLWLLEHRDVEVDGILALTFTQKAAAEMYERIHLRLQEGGAPFRRALESFDRAQISTLDSFCAEIVRNCCELFGLDSRFRSDEEALARLAEDEALAWLLEHLEDPQLARLMHLHGFQALWTQLLAELGARHFLLPGPVELRGLARRQLERCRADLGELFQRLTPLLSELAALPGRTATLRGNQAAAEALAGLRQAVEREAYGEAASLASAAVLRRVGSGGAEDLERMNGLVEAIKPLLSNVSLLGTTLARRELLEASYALLEDFAARMIEAKRREGLVGFQDVAELAVHALLVEAPLRQHYKRRFRYILIDEFQDCNRLQRDLLFLLAEADHDCAPVVPSPQQLQPDKLFFVGDEKQSIYRFRGAEVSVFKALQREIEGSGGRTVELNHNYRSESGLIEFHNLLFGRMLAGEEGGREFEARFQRMRKGGEDSLFRPQIRLLLQSADGGSREETEDDGGDREAGGAAAEAHAVVSFIHEAVAGGNLPLPDGAGLRPAAYGDFAVLLRSTGNQPYYERMLRHFAVPYTTQGTRGLFLEAPAGDIYQLLQVAMYPEDRTAYAGLLRSPFVNVSDETMIRLLLQETPGEPFSAVDSAPAEERRRLEMGRWAYGMVREAADRLPAAQLLYRIWYDLGYRYYLLRDPRYHSYLEHFDYLMGLAQEADRQGRGLAAFLDFLRGNLGRYERLEEIEVPPSRSPGVQLLTIHRAKGLQFPVVILADMGNAGRSGQAGLYAVSERYGLTLNLGPSSYFTRLGSDEAREEELAEIKRLLYVACTRARHHLVLTGSLGSLRSGGRRRPAERSHLALLLRALGLEMPRSDRPQERGLPSESGLRDLKLEPIPALPRQWWRLAPPAGVRRAGASLEAMDRLARAASPLRRVANRRDVSVSELAAAAPALWTPDGAREAGGERRASGERSAPPEPELRPAAGAPGDSLAAVQVVPGLETAVGSLVHRLLARRLERAATPLEPSSEDLAIAESDWRELHVPQERKEQAAAAALTLARGFLGSELGRRAAAAPQRRCELPFLHLWQGPGGPLYISGQVDLFFRDRGGACLLDYKTDRPPPIGERIPPDQLASHAVQLGLYALAFRELLGGEEIEACLFLLRSGQLLRYPRELPWEELLPRLMEELNRSSWSPAAGSPAAAGVAALAGPWWPPPAGGPGEGSL